MAIAAELAPLGFLILAAAALLIAYAFRFLIADPVAALLRNLPLIGDAVAGAVHDAVNGFIGGLEADIDRRVQSITDLIDAVSGAIQYVLNTASDGIELLFGGLRGLQSLLTSVQRQIQSTIGDVARDAQHALDDAARALSRIAGVASTVQHLIQSGIQHLIDQAVSAVRDTIRNVQHGLQDALDQAVRAVRVAILGIVASQLAGIRDWVRTVVQAATRPIQDLITDIQHRVDNLVHDFGHRLDGLARDLEGLQTQIGVIPLIGLVPWIKSIADTLTKITTECIEPGCNYLGPQLDALNALQSAATLALAAELLSRAVNDPSGFARDVPGIIGGADTAARDVFRQATGR